MDSKLSWVSEPPAEADKYSRGVLGMLTGSSDYPGAAVLGVQAAIRTGVGMVRYLGPADVAWLVMQRRPEIVTAPGRVQAWLVGSGTDPSTRLPEATSALRDALGQGLPCVIDAGALDVLDALEGPAIITPHYRELARLLGTAQLQDIAADPGSWAARAAGELGVTVLLKGSMTHIAAPGGRAVAVHGGPGWLATAGSGDVLAGILGALVAVNHAAVEADPEVLVDLAAEAVLIHGTAATIASDGAPIAALDIADAITAAIRQLRRG